MLSSLYTIAVSTLTWLGTSSHLHPSPYVEPSVLSSDLHGRLAALRREWDIPGVSLAVVTGPRITGKGWASEVHGLGVAREDGQNVTDQTYWAIASNSKLFTALSVGLLIENQTLLANGQVLTWTTKVKDVLPEWKLADEYASDHTEILDLLSMRSGMPRHDFVHRGEPASSIVEQMRYLRPSAELRHDYQYNNMHYFVLSEVVRELSNRSFTDFVEKHFFEPLNLTATYNSLTAGKTGRRAEGFLRMNANVTACDGWDGGSVKRECLGEAESFGWWTAGTGLTEAGAGGIVMTGEDMTKWIRELLHPTHIRPVLIAKTREPHMPAELHPFLPDESPRIYGLAQDTYYHRGHLIVEHGGRLPGQISVLMLVPESDLGLFIVSNDDMLAPGVNQAMAYMVLDELLGMKKRDWRRELMRLMFKLKKDWAELPDHPVPAIPDISGDYRHDAYGLYHLVKVHPASSTGPDLELSVTAAQARHLLEQQLISGPPIRIDGPMYLVELNKTFASHLVLTHFSGSLYNWTVLDIYNTSRGPRPVSGVGIGSAIVTDEGMGMFGDFWGAGSGTEKVHAFERAKEDNAEVWFKR